MLSFEPLLECATADHIRTQTARLATAMGFAHWAFTVRTPTAWNAQAAAWSIDNLPTDLGHDRIERAMQPAREMAAGIPCCWCLRPAQAAGTGATGGQGSGQGSYCGLSVPVRERPDVDGLMLLAAPGAWSIDALKQARPAALLLSRYLYLACLPHIERFRESQVPSLSAREIDCLAWAAQGKTAWETSCLLGISRHTVKFHLRNATMKLGATTRQLAITKSIRMGLLSTRHHRPGTTAPQ